MMVQGGGGGVVVYLASENQCQLFKLICVIQLVNSLQPNNKRGDKLQQCFLCKKQTLLLDKLTQYYTSTSSKSNVHMMISVKPVKLPDRFSIQNPFHLF